jgi:hypothetical protein
LLKAWLSEEATMARHLFWFLVLVFFGFSVRAEAKPWLSRVKDGVKRSVRTSRKVNSMERHLDRGHYRLATQMAKTLLANPSKKYGLDNALAHRIRNAGSRSQERDFQTTIDFANRIMDRISYFKRGSKMTATAHVNNIESGIYLKDRMLLYQPRLYARWTLNQLRRITASDVIDGPQSKRVKDLQKEARSMFFTLVRDLRDLKQDPRGLKSLRGRRAYEGYAPSQAKMKDLDTMSFGEVLDARFQ